MVTHSLKAGKRPKIIKKQQHDSIYRPPFALCPLPTIGGDVPPPQMWRTLWFESPPVQSYCGGPGATLPLNTQHSLCRTPCELRPVETAAGYVCKCCKIVASRLSACSLHITHVSPRWLWHLVHSSRAVLNEWILLSEICSFCSPYH